MLALVILLAMVELRRQEKLESLVRIQDHRKRNGCMSPKVPIMRIADVLHDHFGRLEFFFIVRSVAAVNSGLRGSGIGRLNPSQGG